MTGKRRSKPYHRRFHEDALNGYRRLSLELRGAYTTILDVMYDTGGPVRDEPRLMCAHLDCDLRVWKRIRSALVDEHAKLKAYTDADGVSWLVNDRVQTELGLQSYAELTANLSPKLPIANAELSPKSDEKRSKNNERRSAKKTETDPPIPLPIPLPPTPKGESEEIPKGLTPTPETAEISEAFRLWNETAERCGLPIAQDLTEPRRRALQKRLKPGGLDRWREALAKVEASAFLCGERPDKDGRVFRAHLDFVLQASSFQKLIEGTYRADRKPTLLQVAAPIDPLATWRRRVGEFTRNGFWNDCDWDAMPGKPGCRAPAAVLAEFGFGSAEVIPLPTSDRSAA